MPAKKTPARTASKPAERAAPAPAKPFAPPASPPPSARELMLNRALRDALVARLNEAERQFLGGFPLAAKPMIAEVAEKLKNL